MIRIFFIMSLIFLILIFHPVFGDGYELVVIGLSIITVVLFMKGQKSGTEKSIGEDFQGNYRKASRKRRSRANRCRFC